MTRLAAMLRQRNIELTVVVYPWPDQIVRGDTACRATTFWKRWCRRQGVDFLTLFPAFDAGDRDTVLDACFLPGDVHWNERGNRLVADAYMKHRNGRVSGARTALPPSSVPPGVP
jgi:hypothetical protein